MRGSVRILDEDRDGMADLTSRCELNSLNEDIDKQISDSEEVLEKTSSQDAGVSVVVDEMDAQIAKLCSGLSDDDLRGILSAREVEYGTGIWSSLRQS